MKKWLVILVLSLAPLAHAQSACSSTGWGHVWASADSRATGTGSNDNTWNTVTYMNSLQKWYRWLTDKDSLTPNDNAIGFYGPQTNCSLTTNPWTLTTLVGGSQTGYSPPGTYNYYAGVGFNGSSLCDGAAATKDSTTLCLAGVESRNFPFSNCTTNGSGAGSCGAYLIDDEVVEYGTITRSSADGTNVLLGNLVRGSRHAAGNPDCSGTACNHSVQSPVTRYVFVASPTAAQAPGNGGMKVDVGAGLAAVPSGGDVPWLRHSSSSALWDNNAGRMWQLGGWLDGPSFQDLWYRCVPGATSTNGKCDATKIAQGWIRVVTPTFFPKGHFETAAVYDPEHDAIFAYGSDATNDMWVYSDSTNATIGSTGGNFVQLYPTCQNANGSTLSPCPSIAAQAMAWDPDDHLVMMFGGRYGTTRYDSIVVYNPANTTVSGIPGRTMRVLASANLGCSSSGQSVCYFPAFTYDSKRHIGVLYAGPGQLLKYTYASNGGTWANTGVTGGPPARDSDTQLFPALSYAPELDMYLYASAVTAPSRTDTWQLPGASLSGAITYTWSITVAGAGAGSVSDGAGFSCSSGTCIHDYAAGATPTFTATPSGGGSFAGWSAGSGDLSACSGTGTCGGTARQASGVTATFNASASASTTFSGVTLKGVSAQ